MDGDDKYRFCAVRVNDLFITFDFTKGNEMIIHNKHAEPWKVTVVDTGLNTQTGGRIKRVKDFVGDDTFMVTYGDAVGDINIDSF